MSETVLQLVQDVLSDADSDDVSTIGETVEAGQAARLLKSVHDTITDEYNLETHKGLRTLTGMGDTTRPTHLLIPEGVHAIEQFEYDVRDDPADPAAWRRIGYLNPDDFLRVVTHYNNDGAEIQVVTDFDGGSFQIRNDVHPRYYTSFDNEHVVCDSFLESASSTLMGSKTRILATLRPTLVLADATVVDLPPHLMSLLKTEFRYMYFELFKDGAPEAVTRAAFRQRVRADRTKHMIREKRPSDSLPDYGRHV